MKNYFIIASLLFMTNNTFASSTQPNDLVKFLAGEWDNISFEISNDKPVKKEEYHETMLIKDDDTLTITAHGLRDGKDVTKDMHLEVRDDLITMSQGAFKATGTREDSVYSMKAIFEGMEYRFRLYTLGDKYVFHRETWKNGKIQQIDMSYLLRK